MAATGTRDAAYLRTRVAILGNRLLSSEHFDALIERPQDEIINQRFGQPVTESSADSARLERALMRALLADLAILIRPMTGPVRDFFLFWARRFELYNLKAIIRGKLRTLPEREIEQLLLDVPFFASLDNEQLLRTESAAELLRQIEVGSYGSIARQARKALEAGQDTVAVEAAIDQRYYTGLTDRIHQMPRDDARAMHALMGSRIDRINLAWLLRFRFAYGLSPTETYYHLIPHGRHLRRERLLQLVDGADFAAVIAALPERLRRRLDGIDSALGVERRLEELNRERAAEALRDSPSSSARVLAYLMLREHELRHLRAIVTAHQLGLPARLLDCVVGSRGLAYPRHHEA